MLDREEANSLQGRKTLGRAAKVLNRKEKHSAWKTNTQQRRRVLSREEEYPAEKKPCVLSSFRCATFSSVVENSFVMDIYLHVDYHILQIDPI